MNARRATWILFAVVVLFGLGMAEIAARVADRRAYLDPAEDAYWYVFLHKAEKISTEGEDVEFHPRLGWRIRENFTRGEVHTNNYGFRGAKPTNIERTPGVGRIMLIGDSYTFGLGVPDSDTFGAIIEDKLENVEVLNAGTNGWGTDQAFLDYREDRKRFDPDVIVVGIYEDDYNRNGVSAREYLKPRFIVQDDQLVLTNVPIPRPDELDRETLPHFSRPRIVDVLFFGYRKVRWKFAKKYQRDGPFEEKSEILRLIFRDLNKLAQADGRTRHVVVLTWPTIFYEAGWDSARIRKRVLEVAAKENVPAYDITEQLKQRAKKDGMPVYDPKSSHWNRAGHEVAAQQLLEHFEKNDILQP